MTQVTKFAIRLAIAPTILLSAVSMANGAMVLSIDEIIVDDPSITSDTGWQEAALPIPVPASVQALYVEMRLDLDGGEPGNRVRVQVRQTGDNAGISVTRRTLELRGSPTEGRLATSRDYVWLPFDASTQSIEWRLVGIDDNPGASGDLQIKLRGGATP